MTSSEPPDGSIARPPAHIRSTCSICFEDLRQADKVSALVCGHIYHHGCISQWIGTKRQCPSCRRAVPKNGFIEKLFFDIQRIEGEKPPEIDYREEHYVVSAALKLEKDNSTKMETEVKELKTQIKCLEKKVIKEKDRYKATVPKLEATIRHLTISSEDTEYYKRELVEAKNKLKATEFYKVLMTNSDQPEKQLETYLCKNGSLDSEKFFQLQKSQIKDLNERRRENAREIENLKAEINALKRKGQEDASTIKTLKSSVLELRERANVETPITNKRLRAVLDTETPPPAKRVSLGFDDSSQLIEEDLSFFKKKENKTPPAPVNTKPSTSTVPPFSFDDDDDEEYFRTPKITTKPKKIEEKPKEVSEDSFEFDIAVPPSIINRMPRSCGAILKVKPNIPIFPKDAQEKKRQKRLASEEGFEDFFQLKPIIRNQSTTKNAILTEKPKNVMENTMKRSQSVNLAPKKTNVPSNTATISSFFSRTTSSKNLNTDNKEYVTID